MPDAAAVKGLIYAVGAVGSKEVLDRATGKLVPVTKENAPHSVDGINYAPFAAFGGWAGAINAKSDQKKKDAAYAFLSYMNQAAQSNVDVTIGATGYNPYRNSQLASTDLWVKAGMPPELAENYLGAINGALNNLNMASDMKIPGAQKYTGVVLDTELARYLAGETTVDEALANIEAGWEEVTEDFGRDDQIEVPGLGAWALATKSCPMSRPLNVIDQPGTCSGWQLSEESWGEWFDRHSGTFFIVPAVMLILIFAIFPTFYSIVFALSRVRFTADGLHFRFVGFQNFYETVLRQRPDAFPRQDRMRWAFWASVVLCRRRPRRLWWLYRSADESRPGSACSGRLISAAMAIFLAWFSGASLLSGNSIGTLCTTLFYVFVGCAASVRHRNRPGLPLLAADSGKSFFRVIFFIPLMITPLGWATPCGWWRTPPRVRSSPSHGALDRELGLVGRTPGRARFAMMICDSWQWIPFIFIFMLAALENVPRDHVEAAKVDGASSCADFPRDHLAADHPGCRDRDADPRDRGLQDRRPPQHHDGRRARHPPPNR